LAIPNGLPHKLAFRTSISLYIMATVFVVLFLGLAVFVSFKRNDWTAAAVVLGIAVPLYLLLGYLRFEIDADGFRYRGPLTRRRIEFTDVARGYFETVRARNSPQGAAFFYVALRNGHEFKVNLRVFPIRAAAWLFTALDLHEVPIDAPETWSARRMNDQIRAAQTRLSV